MILSIVSGKERSDNPVPATSGEVRPWARAELKVKSETKKIKEIKIPPRKIYDLCFLEESIEKISLRFYGFAARMVKRFRHQD